jgi:hypothetical protein
LGTDLEKYFPTSLAGTRRSVNGPLQGLKFKLTHAARSRKIFLQPDERPVRVYIRAQWEHEAAEVVEKQRMTHGEQRRNSRQTSAKQIREVLSAQRSRFGNYLEEERHEK